MNSKTAKTLAATNAFQFVLIVGVVNLFGDMTYEGGGSINGPFLGTLGASAAAISIIAGLGEFFGYSLRSVAGHEQLLALHDRRCVLRCGVNEL